MNKIKQMVKKEKKNQIPIHDYFFHQIYSYVDRYNKKMCCAPLIERFPKICFFLVIKKTLLNQTLCTAPYDHHVSYTEIFKESANGARDKDDVIIIYTDKNLHFLYFDGK